MYRVMHMVHLPVSPGVGGRYSQHGTVTSPTLVKSLQEDTLRYTPTQKQIGIYKRHHVLVKLCSMKIALPGAQGLCSHMQEAIHHIKGKS